MVEKNPHKHFLHREKRSPILTVFNEMTRELAYVSGSRHSLLGKSKKKESRIKAKELAVDILGAPKKERKEIKNAFQALVEHNPALALTTYYCLKREKIVPIRELRELLGAPKKGNVVNMNKARGLKLHRLP